MLVNNGIFFNEVAPVKEHPIGATLITENNVNTLRMLYASYDFEGEIEVGNWFIIELWDLWETAYYALTPEEFAKEFIFIETGEEN